MVDLPVPDPAFRWSLETWGAALRCRPLEHVAQHLFTTRQLQLRGAVDQARGWDLAARGVGGVGAQVIRVTQVHGRAVRVVHSGASVEGECEHKPAADAIVSNASGVVLAVQVADCVPLLLADARSGAVAAVHAGWRGTAARVAGAAVERLEGEFGTQPADLVVAIGPSIGPCCYEVGADLLDAFRAAGATESELARWFIHAPGGAWLLDLWSASRDQLLDAGVQSHRIHACGLCTKTHVRVFDSYRADGPNAGRSAALIRVPVR